MLIKNPKATLRAVEPNKAARVKSPIMCFDMS
jgi:hypothetical protein